MAELGFTTPSSASSIASKENPKCPPGEHWVRAYHRRAYIRADGTKVVASDVLAHCQKDPPSYAKWRERLKNSDSPPDWSKREKNKNWTEEERERVFEAISELPEVLLLDSLKSIHRAEKSSEFEQNPAAGDEGFVALYDAAFGEKHRLSRIIAHEFAHELFRQIPDTKRKDYAASTGWRQVFDPKTKKYRYIPGRFDYVEDDGPISVTEDFANNVEYQLFDPKKLSKITPEASSWLQKNFGDKLKLSRGAH